MRAAFRSPVKGPAQSSPGGGERRRFQRRVAAGLRSQGGGGKELFGPGSASAVSTRQVVRLSITFLPLASSAENEELLLGAPEKILKATLLPEGEALGTAVPRPGVRAPLFQQREVVAAAGHALPALRNGRDLAQAATGGDVEQGIGW